jgi:hypothetical protein
MTMTYAEINEVYNHLRKVKQSFGSKFKRHDRAVVMIGACILHRFDTRYQILKALGALGLSRTFVASVLDDHTGDVTGSHFWSCSPDRQYRFLDGEPSSPTITASLLPSGERAGQRGPQA